MSGSGVFTPKAAGTILITAATTSGSTATPLNKPASATAVRIKNEDATAANFVYYSFGTSTITVAAPGATTPGNAPTYGGNRLDAGESLIIGISEAVTHVAVISAAGSPVVAITVGNAS
jgi:hypothetical protein